jgi:hypothetical protein
MTVRTLARLLALALACALSGTALADARIEYRTTEGGGASMQSLLVGHGKLRTDADGDVSVVLDPASDSMLMLNHADRTFTRMNRADLERMSAGLGAAMSQMEQALANMPPEVRAQMEGSLGGMLGGDAAKVSINPTGQNDTVAGHPCVIYRTQMQGETVNETCMGAVDAFDELPASDARTLHGAMAMTQRIAESLAKGPLARYVNVGSFQPGMLPLRVTDFDGGKRSTSEFAGIDDAPLPADLFAVPSGYTEQKLEMPDLGSLGE